MPETKLEPGGGGGGGGGVDGECTGSSKKHHEAPGGHQTFTLTKYKIICKHAPAASEHSP